MYVSMFRGSAATTRPWRKPVKTSSDRRGDHWCGWAPESVALEVVADTVGGQAGRGALLRKRRVPDELGKGGVRDRAVRYLKSVFLRETPDAVLHQQ